MIPPAIHSAQKRKKVTGGVSLPVTRRPGAGIMVSSDFRFPSCRRWGRRGITSQGGRALHLKTGMRLTGVWEEKGTFLQIPANGEKSRHLVLDSLAWSRLC